MVVLSPPEITLNAPVSPSKGLQRLSCTKTPGTPSACRADRHMAVLNAHTPPSICCYRCKRGIWNACFTSCRYTSDRAVYLTWHDKDSARDLSTFAPQSFINQPVKLMKVAHTATGHVIRSTLPGPGTSKCSLEVLAYMLNTLLQGQTVRSETLLCTAWLCSLVIWLSVAFKWFPATLPILTPDLWYQQGIFPSHCRSQASKPQDCGWFISMERVH